MPQNIVRAVALGLCVALAAGCERAPHSAAWDDYRERFIARDGRVIDTGNAGVSHSEGQGWGLLLATAYDDRATFERVWTWTREHLALRDDHLFAWRWRPDREPAVDDYNNASDGDLYIAWALVRAGDRWQEPAYTAAAAAILTDVRRLLVRDHGGLLVLLPGANGFEHGAHVVLNPSYWIFPAFAEFSLVDPSPVWDALAASGRTLLARAHFGRWGLPPDWLALSTDGSVAPAEAFPARFGYDAIRVPLALAWDAGPEEAEDVRPIFDAFRALHRHYAERACLPAWISIVDDAVSADPATPGMHAIWDFALNRRSPHAGRRLPPNVDYYAASLLLLAHVAATETSR